MIAMTPNAAVAAGGTSKTAMPMIAGEEQIV